MANAPDTLNAAKSLREAAIVFLLSVLLQILALIFGLAPVENPETQRVVLVIAGFVQLILSILFAINLLLTSKYLEGRKENRL